MMSADPSTSSSSKTLPKLTKRGRHMDTEGDKDKISAYRGPIASMDDMIAGCDIDNLGLQILLGPSKVCDGLGLFVRLSEDATSSLQAEGTPVCGYAKGTLVAEADGTFTVAYAFFGTRNGVIFQQTLMPLIEAIGIAANITGSINMQHLVDGHELLWDAEAEEILIQPTDGYDNRYFIPDPVEADETGQPIWGPSNLGMYANDCAYSETVTELDYNNNSPDKNVLRIVWRLEMRQGKLAPSWPVVITTRDVQFKNTEPMEVGLHYSWKYWAAARALQLEEDEKGAAA